MSYSVSLPSFVTPAINGQPKSLDHSIRASKIDALAGNKRMCSRRNDGLKNPLVSYFNGECRTECKTIESTEMTHLFCGASIYQAVKSDGSEGNSQDTGLTSLFAKRKRFFFSHANATRTPRTPFARNLKFKFDQSRRVCSRISTAVCISRTEVRK